MGKINFKKLGQALQIFNNEDRTEWHGAVLSLVIDDYLFLIKRSEKVPTHKGQLAMPGGHRDAGENSPEMVALREFTEETSIEAKNVDVIGNMKAVYTNRNQRIIPVCGRLNISKEEFLADLKSNGEWEDGILISFKSLCDRDSWDYGLRFGADKNGELLFRSIAPDEYISNNSDLNQQNYYMLWGATARITWRMLDLLAEY